MNKSIYIINKNSNEIYALTLPRSILNFCDYDFSYFHDRCVELCNDAIKYGDYDIEQISELRSSLKGCHIYYEQNIRILYDKLVIDCWIDFLCRKDSIGTTGLWNRFMGCNTPFERAMFTRLCEYRYNHAINQWLNIIRIQDYARKKLDFLFDAKATGTDEAKIRRNYFDLMFNVTACELGCEASEIASTKVFSTGRIPNSPFIMPTLAKDILKNNLSDLNYDEGFEKMQLQNDLSDQIAMDAFARMKNSLPKKIDTMNIAERCMKNIPEKVYLPTSFKAVIDLEFDAILENGAILQHCAMCGRYFIKDSEYTHDYCNKVSRHGMTCLEIYERDNPKSNISQQLKKKCEDAEVYMLNRIGKDLTRAEYDGWRDYLHAMMKQVENGDMPKEELESFVEYSKEIDISKSEPVKSPTVLKEQNQKGVKTVKPFMPERVDRSVLEEQQLKTTLVEPFYNYNRNNSSINRNQETKPNSQKNSDKAQNTARIIKSSNSSMKAFETNNQPVSPFNEPFSNVNKPISLPITEEIKNSSIQEQNIQNINEFEDFLPFVKTQAVKKNAAAISAYGKIVDVSEQPINAITQKADIEDKMHKETITRKMDFSREYENPFAEISSIFDEIESQGDLSSVPAVDENTNKHTSIIHNNSNKLSDFKPIELVEFSDLEKERDESFLHYKKQISESVSENKNSSYKIKPSSKNKDEIPKGIWTEERNLFSDEVNGKALNEDFNISDELNELTAKNNSPNTGKIAQKAPIKRRTTNKTQHVFDAIMKPALNDKNKK